MSRLVVKNLPNVTEEGLKRKFADHGTITDVKLLYKDDGTFRQLAHIGYAKEEEAQLALKKMNNTYIDGNKIEVDIWAESKVKSSKSVEKRQKNLKNGGSDQQKKAAVKKHHNTTNTVKVSNLPLKFKHNQLREFFAPLKPQKIRIPPNKSTYAYVQLKDRKDFKKALTKDKAVLGGKKVKVAEYVVKLVEGAASDSASSGKVKVDLELLMQTGRLFVRNLAYDVAEEDLHELFSAYQPIKEITLPRDSKTNKSKGFAYVTLLPEQALKAYTELDRSIFHGRIVHLIPSELAEKDGQQEDNVASQAKSSYKKEKLKALKEEAAESHNWNTLFFSTQALMGILKKKYIDSQCLLNPTKGQAPAVTLALAETILVDKMKKFFVENGINFDNSVNPSTERSSTIIVVKNLPANTDAFELKSRFDVYGPIKRFLKPKEFCIFAIVEYEHPHHAQKAFKKEAYAEFHRAPLFLEWAPQNIFKTLEEVRSEKEQKETKMECDEPTVNSTLYIKNINFKTNEADLEKHFAKVGKIVQVTISRNKVNNLSNGFGFVEFADPDAAQSAIKTLQFYELDDHRLELSISKQPSKKPRKIVARETNTVAEGSKLLVRNIAFQATKGEICKLFRTFGELSFVRLPKKKTGTGAHRGFAFVEYKDQTDAMAAYNKLKDSTHLYGRRLVVEWAKPEQKEDEEL